MEIRISPKSIAVTLAAMIACLTLIHVGLQGARFLADGNSFFGLVWFFGLGSDGNVPTFYSAIAILVCAALLTALGVGELNEQRIPALYWFGLAAIFVFLAVDEMLMLHERLIEPLRGALDTSGIFYYAWVIPYGIALVVFLLVYARFLLLLPGRSRTLFVAAGAIFVGGAIGVEMIGGLQSEAHGNANVTYVALQTIEEILEMVGIALFAYALADYGVRRHSELRVVIR